MDRGIETARLVTQEPEDWQVEFNISGRSLADTGESPYFVLNPGFQLVLESRNDRVTVTVLDEKKEIDGIVTRVVEERSEEFGELEEITRSFYAIDSSTGDVFFFGTESDVYESGELVANEGNWVAFRDGSPGLYMPGAPEVGMKYYQELVPGVAQSRAEVTSTSAVVTTPAGVFERALVTKESSPLEPGKTEEKVYGRGVGLIEDGSLSLVSYGYIDLSGR
jgi:hypothetical protein